MHIMWFKRSRHSAVEALGMANLMCVASDIRFIYVEQFFIDLNYLYGALKQALQNQGSDLLNKENRKKDGIAGLIQNIITIILEAIIIIIIIIIKITRIKDMAQNIIQEMEINIQEIMENRGMIQITMDIPLHIIKTIKAIMIKTIKVIINQLNYCGDHPYP